MVGDYNHSSAEDKKHLLFFLVFVIRTEVVGGFGGKAQTNKMQSPRNKIKAKPNRFMLVLNAFYGLFFP